MKIRISSPLRLQLDLYETDAIAGSAFCIRKASVKGGLEKLEVRNILVDGLQTLFGAPNFNVRTIQHL